MEPIVRGTTNIPIPDGKSIWLVVEFGGEWWPQKAPIVPFPISGEEGLSWTVLALVGVDGDRDKPFGLFVILTPPEVDDEFFAWFKAGKESGMFPGFPSGELLRDGVEIRAGVSVIRQ